MLSSRKGRGTCERERAASELVQVGLVGDPGVLPLGLHLWVRRHAELDAWVGNEVSTRLHGLDDFEQLTYLLAYLDEEARDHAVQQHVGEEAAAHLRGHSHVGPNAELDSWFAHPVRTVRGALGPSRPVPLRYVPNPAGWYAWPRGVRVSLAAHELQEAVDTLRRVRALHDGSEGAGGGNALHVGGLGDRGRRE